jgi:hypothetical protein
MSNKAETRHAEVHIFERSTGPIYKLIREHHIVVYV